MAEEDGLGGDHGPTEESDWFAAMLCALLELLVAHLPDSWTDRRGDAFGILTRIRIPTLNGVLATTPRARSEDVAALLARVREAGVPYCVQLHPNAGHDLVAAAATGAASPAGDVAAMVASAYSGLERALEVGGLRVREVSFDDLGSHLSVLSEGFGLPADVLAPLVGVLRFAGVHHYVGWTDGVAAATGTGVRLADAVGIFNVATRPAFRRRGYASALTARAALDGFASGATRAFLQSAPVAEQVYQGLGFRTIERWKLWIGGLDSTGG